VVEDARGRRHAIAALLCAGGPGFASLQVAGPTRLDEELRRRARSGTPPGVVLVSAALGERRATEAVATSRDALPSAPVFVVGRRQDRALAARYVDAGASGHVSEEKLVGLGQLVQDALARMRVAAWLEQTAEAGPDRSAVDQVQRMPQLGVFAKDAQLRYVYASDDFARAFGVRPADLIGKPDGDLVPAAVAQRWESEDEEVMRTGRPIERLEPHGQAGEEARPLRYLEVPVRDESEAVCGVLGRWDPVEVGRYAPDRHPAVSQRVLRIPLTREGTIAGFGTDCMETYGLSVREVLGLPLTRLEQPVSREMVRRAIARAAQGEDVVGLRVVHATDYGLLVPASLSLRPVRDGSGPVTGLVAEVDAWSRPPTQRLTPEGAAGPLDVIPDLSYRVGVADNQFEYVNPWADRVLGFSPDELQAMGASGFETRIHPDEVEHVRTATGQLLRAPTQGGLASFEYRFRRKDGTYVALREERLLDCDEMGRPAGIVGAVRLADESAEGGRVLRLSGPASTAALADQRSVSLKDADLAIAWSWSDAGAPYGRSPERVVGKTDYDLFPREAAENYRRQDRSALRQLRDFPVVVSGVLGVTEEGRVLEHRKAAVRDRTGTTVGLLLFTTQTREQSPEVMAPYWTALVEATDDAVIGLDHYGAIVAWNRAAERLYGYGAETVRGGTIGFLAREEDRPGLLATIESVASGQSVRGYETVHLTGAGRPVDVSLTISPVRVPEGAVVGVAVISRDITGRKRGEEALRRSEERFRRIVETVFDGINICEWDPGVGRKKVVFCNDRYVQMSGYSREQLMATDNILDFIESRETPERTLEATQRLEAGLPATGRASWKRPDGKENVFEWSAAAVQVDEHTRYLYGVDRDVTEHVHMEKELRDTVAELILSNTELGQFTFVPGQGTPEGIPHAQEIEQVAREIREDPVADRDFRAAAEQLHMSYGHFRRLFRQCTGRSPHDYLLLWRMRRAAKALREDDRPVKAVALEFGYVNPAQFATLFRKKIGLSPTEYREAMAKL
jgi:PAS domain S-box-containing protein